MSPKFKLMAKVTGNVDDINIVGIVTRIHRPVTFFKEILYDVQIIEPFTGLIYDLEQIFFESELELVH